MTKKLKSLLAFALSAMMLFTACGEKDEKDDDEKKVNGKNDASSSLNVDFEFKGIDSAVSYAENAIAQVEDALEGKVDTGVTTEISVSFGDAIINEIGVDVKEFKLANSAKVKVGIVANDMILYYDGNSLISLNTVIDDSTVYFRVPEVSDSYIKGDVSDMESLLTTTNQVENNVAGSLAMVANPGMIEGANADAIASAMENIDEEKISELIDEIVKIVEKNMPKGEKGDKVSGDINGIKYDYTTKIFKITGKNTYDTAVEFFNLIKDDKDIAAAYDSVMADTKQEMIDSGYYTEAEVEEVYPSFDKLISDALTSMEAEKEDAYSSKETVDFVVYYDGEEATGICFEDETNSLELVLVDRAEEIGLKISADNEEFKEYTDMTFSVEGVDGKYNALFKVVNDYEEDEFDSTAEFGFNSDVEIVDEESGAFKGEIEFFMGTGDERMSLVLTSDSTAKNTDISMELIFNNESMITIGLTSVETNASDVTIPSGKVYDFSNEADVDAFSNEADLEGLESHFRTVLGDDLFAVMFESEDYDDDYDYDYDYDFDYEYDYEY